MTDDRLTPEERAVIEEAVAWRTHYPSNFPARLADKVEALKASLRPQPVECLMTRDSDNKANPDGWESAWLTADDAVRVGTAEVWRITITPIERVR